jgi:RNA polymerase sigma-70 factor (ECF subfamily)
MNDDIQEQLPLLLPRLWRFAWRLTRDIHDAQDLVQRCCLRALERRAQWQPGTSMLSWLFAIEHSIWINELRRPQRLRTESLDRVDAEGATFADLHRDAMASDPLQQAHYRQVVACVEALPEAQRTVMLLVAVEGFSYREAAEVIGVPIGTVMSRLARARLRIGQSFGCGTSVLLTCKEDHHGRR